jgi:hypothetical protein
MSEHVVNGMTIKDSGTRRDFGTGSVRDAATGKGRMDLLPVFAMDRLYRANLARPLRMRFTKFLPLPAPDATPTIAQLKDTSFRLAAWWLRGCRGEEQMLEGAVYFAMLALEWRTFEREGRDLVPPPFDVWAPLFALVEVSKLYEAGCAKYGDRNWEKGQPLHIYMDSGLRHLAKDMRGDEDEDHLVAACWNFLCCLETDERIKLGSLPEALADGIPGLPKTMDKEFPGLNGPSS